MMQIDISIDQLRLRRDLDLLSKFAPALRKELMVEMRAQARPVAANAAARLRALAQTHATGRWQEDAAAGYKVSQRLALLRLINKTRGGSILEFAGSVNPQGKTKQGRSLINTLNARYGRPGRLLWQEWDRQAPTVMAGVLATVEQAEAVLNAALGFSGRG